MFLQLLTAALPLLQVPVDPTVRLQSVLKTSPSYLVFADPSSAANKKVHLVRQWQGDFCRFQVNNSGRDPVRIRAIVLFEVEHGLPATTAIHGEGFQMLSQTAGTIAEPVDLGAQTDREHYDLAEPAGFRSLYGALHLDPAGSRQMLFGFASCKRFAGRFELSTTTLRAVLDAEGVAIEPGTSWDLEELFFDDGDDRETLYAELAKAIEAQHPSLALRDAPRGWCSRYAFGPEVTAKQVTANLAALQRELPGLRYVQIDDGYQQHMGDWLEAGPAFGGDVKEVLLEIDRLGLEPALWMAPFIASAGSKLFREHADWFVKGADGAPLRSDTVGSGGWRQAPWYCLDGTHPAVQEHLEQLFAKVRKEWGVTYFKLDALTWGAIHSGRFHDRAATRIEAYRRGMEAIRRGAGDAFLLGCNQPMWASFGLVDGTRTSMDVERSLESFARTGRQNLLRRWMDGRLWWNDPDCALLAPGPSEDDTAFHAALLLANGGLVLSGDDLTTLPPARIEMLRRLSGVPSTARRRGDDHFEHFTIEWRGGELHALLNWGATPRVIPINVERRSRILDGWTGKEVGEAQGRYHPPAVPPRSGRVYEVRPALPPARSAREGDPRTPLKQ